MRAWCGPSDRKTRTIITNCGLLVPSPSGCGFALLPPKRLSACGLPILDSATLSGGASCSLASVDCNIRKGVDA